MLNNINFDNIFHYLLLISVLISFYIFIKTIIMNHDDKKHMFSTWQFPMLLAIYLDLIYNTTK